MGMISAGTPLRRHPKPDVNVSARPAQGKSQDRPRVCASRLAIGNTAEVELMAMDEHTEEYRPHPRRHRQWRALRPGLMRPRASLQRQTA
jgi:hypothetical protein